MNKGPHSSQSHFFTSGKHERIENASPFMGVYSLFIHWISKGTLKNIYFDHLYLIATEFPFYKFLTTELF